MIRRRWSRRDAVAVMLATAVAFVPGAVQAAARGSVVLDAGRCPVVSEAAIRRIVGIELGDLLAGPGAVAGAVQPADRLDVRCEGGAARLRATGRPAVGGAGEAIEREMRLDDFPGDAAPRALALAGVEMLAALSPDVRERIQRERQVVAPAPPAVAANGSEGRRAWVALSAVRRDFFATAGFGGWGGRLDVAARIGDLWMAAGDVEIAGGATAVALGEARTLLVSLGGFWGVRAARGRLAGSLALGARFGWARLEGTPAGGSGALGGRALRPWWGPALAARGTLGSGPIAFLASLEAGIVARGAEGFAGNVAVVAVGGAWLSAGLGVQF